MTPAEIVKLFKLIVYAYPSFDGSDRNKVMLWHDQLQHVDYAAAEERLRGHIAKDKFPPAIADLIGTSQEQIQLKSDAAQHIADIEAWRRTAAPPPARSAVQHG